VASGLQQCARSRQGKPYSRDRYELFRFWCMAAMTLGATDISVPSETIPSMGFDNKMAPGSFVPNSFNWDDVQDLGVVEFVRWMNLLIGHSANSAAEVYCLLTQTGTAMPKGKTFSQELLKFKQNSKAYQSMPAYLHTPLLSHFGFFCNLDLNVPGGKGKASSTQRLKLCVRIYSLHRQICGPLVYFFGKYIPLVDYLILVFL